MHLLTTLFETPVAERRRDFERCLRANAEHPSIKSIIVFFEADEEVGPLESVCVELGPKVVVHRVMGRTSFKEFFALANEQLHGQTVAISNGDILFEPGCGIESAEPAADELWCVTRYAEAIEGGWAIEPHPRHARLHLTNSQDTWLFRAPIRPFPCDILLGISGCDSYLMLQAINAGIRVKNPARSIRSLHIHKTDYAKRTLASGMSYYDRPDYRHFRLPIVSAADPAYGYLRAWATFYYMSLRDALLRTAERLLPSTPPQNSS